MDPSVSVAKRTLQRSPSQREAFQENFFKNIEDGVLSSPIAQPIADQDLKTLRKIKSGVYNVIIDDEGVRASIR